MWIKYDKFLFIGFSKAHLAITDSFHIVHSSVKNLEVGYCSLKASLILMPTRNGDTLWRELHLFWLFRLSSVLLKGPLKLKSISYTYLLLSNLLSTQIKGFFPLHLNQMKCCQLESLLIVYGLQNLEVVYTISWQTFSSQHRQVIEASLLPQL